MDVVWFIFYFVFPSSSFAGPGNGNGCCLNKTYHTIRSRRVFCLRLRKQKQRMIWQTRREVSTYLTTVRRGPFHYFCRFPPSGTVPMTTGPAVLLASLCRPIGDRTSRKSYSHQYWTLPGQNGRLVFRLFTKLITFYNIIFLSYKLHVNVVTITVTLAKVITSSAKL